MKRAAILLALALLFLAGCGPKEDADVHTITYELGSASHLFTVFPENAKAGDTVEICAEILYDADIHVYVDGEEIEKSHYDSDYWGWSFVMPDREVTVSARFYTKGEIWGGTKENP